MSKAPARTPRTDRHNATPLSGGSSRRRQRAIWVTGWVWAIAFITAQLLVATPAAELAAAAAWGAIAAFSIALGVRAAGWWGFAVYSLVAYILVLLLEAASVAWGVPFGFFEHHMEGPRILDIPLFVPVAYVLFGWPAWMLARHLTGSILGPLSRFQQVTTPIVASFILAGWDLHYDAVANVIQRRATYDFPSGFVGVPLSNFVGWLVTGWIVFQIWALIEKRWVRHSDSSARGVAVWTGAIWAAIPLEVLAGYLAAPTGIIETSGRVFPVRDIYEASFIGGLLTMTLIGLLAIFRAFAPRTSLAQRDRPDAVI